MTISLSCTFEILNAIFSAAEKVRISLDSIHASFGAKISIVPTTGDIIEVISRSNLHSEDL